MKIALVTLDYSPATGGVARYLSNLVNASKGAIDAFTVKPAGHFPYASQIRFMRTLARRGYDRILVSHALPVGTAAWIARKFGGPKYIILMHGLDLRLALRSRRKSWILRRVLRNASLVLVNSSFVANEIRQFDKRIDPKILTPGVEPIAFPARSEARRSLGIAEADVVILTVARLVPRKGIDRLIAAIPLLPQNVRLVVIGDGPDRERLMELVEKTIWLSYERPEKKILFINRSTDEERNRWYAASDIFAFLARDEGDDVEGFGIVCLEAALAGLPVFAGKSGGVTEAVVDGVTGILVDPLDDRSIINALRSLVDHPEEREHLGRIGRERTLRDFQWTDRWNKLQTWL